MALKRPRLTLIVSERTPLIGHDGRLLIVRSQRDVIAWVRELNELQMIAEVQPVFLPMTADQPLPEVWKQLTELIRKHDPTSQGFVITQPIDTVVASGTALSLAIRPLKKPLVVVGFPIVPAGRLSRRSIETYRMLGVRAQLVNAAHIAVSGVPNVMIPQGHRVIQANRAFRSAKTGDWESLGDDIARVVFGIHIDRTKGTIGVGRSRYAPTFAPITVIKSAAHLDLTMIDAQLAPTSKGILVLADDALRPAVLEQLQQRAATRRIPLVIFTSEPLPTSSTRSPFMTIHSVTETTAILKTMWVLGNAASAAERRHLLASNLAGEIVQPEAKP